MFSPACFGRTNPSNAASFESLEPRLLFTATPLITEFLASNSAGLIDEDGDHSDWIELHNAGDTALDLDGWFLTDDLADLTQWALPSVSLAPGQYRVVFASGKDRADADGTELHTSFKLNASGEYFALVQPDGLTVAHDYGISYPGQQEDISYGLSGSTDLSAGSPTGYLTAVTPEAANPEGFTDFVADTSFSVDRGFYSAPISVAITSATPGATLYYTLDGSAPSPGATGTTQYTGPVTLSSTTTLRAIATKPGFVSSNVDTQSYIFLQDVFTQGSSPAGYPSLWSGLAADYGMDPEIVNDPTYQNELIQAFTSLPSLSLVTDVDHLFDGTDGIYTNPLESGAAWERPVSAELIHPDGSQGFQVDAGIRIHGGASRIPARSPKHSFRLYFRSDYGPSKLEYDLFGNGQVTEFDSVVLRAGYNLTWIHNNPAHRELALYAQDEFVRQSQIAAGGEASQGTFVHLYLNGLYWGLYNIAERPGADFAASRYGGDAEDYDAMSHNDTANGSEVADGDAVAWDAMLALAEAGLSSATAYAQIQQFLDVESFADYVLTNIWAGNEDWPHNNWYATRLREPGAQFHFHSWDAETAMVDLNVNRVDADGADGPGRLFQRLRNNEEFRVLVADRAQALFFGDGALTPANQIARLQSITSQIESAVIGESARWGDYRESTPYERDAEWQAELARLTSSYLPQRTAIVIDQLRSGGLYPDTAHDAPSFSQYGGLIPPGSMLTISNNESSGDIYYTTDGSDPRLPGGLINPDAVLYTSAFELPAPALTVRARLLRSGAWSASIQAQFTNGEPTPEQEFLRITEVHYNPSGPTASELAAGFTDGDQFEFIELLNTSSTQSLNLAGVSLVDGAEAVFQDTVFEAGFAEDVEGYVFQANAFNGTGEVGVASGTHTLTSGGDGGALQVALASADNGPDHGSASGAYTRQFTLNSDSEVTISFDYRFNYEGGFENIEIGQAIAEIDGTRLGNYTNGSLVSFVGDGNAGPASDTGWVNFSYTAQLSAGVHTLALGAYYSRSTAVNEGVTAWYDNVVVATDDPLPLAPGERALLVSDLDAFIQRYGQSTADAAAALAQYSGKLANGGETIRLVDANGSIILDFTYEDGDDPGEEDWATTPDGEGPSLVIVNTEGDYDDGNNWAASTITHGTPGADEPVGIAGDITGDGYVGVEDLDQLLAYWGDAAASSPGALAADLDNSSTVGSGDLSIVLANFGNGNAFTTPTSNGAVADDPDPGSDPGNNDTGGGNTPDSEHNAGDSTTDNGNIREDIAAGAGNSSGSATGDTTGSGVPTRPTSTRPQTSPPMQPATPQSSVPERPRPTSPTRPAKPPTHPSAGSTVAVSMAQPKPESPTTGLSRLEMRRVAASTQAANALLLAKPEERRSTNKPADLSIPDRGAPPRRFNALTFGDIKKDGQTL